MKGHVGHGLASGRSSGLFSPDRGTKQFSKLMQYLAEVSASGTHTVAETMVETLPRLRRGASALVVTPSLDKEWVKPVLALREAGVRIQSCIVTPEEIEDAARMRLNAVVGELLVAGVPYAVSTADLPISELFHERSSVSA